MLTEICAEIRNYFVKDIHNGTFQIVGGNIEPLDFLQTGQYFRIVGSTLNDGVYQYPSTTLADETFEGSVWAMAVPPTLIALSAEIEAYNEAGGKTSAFTAESYPNGYSYTRATDVNGVPLNWQKAFSSRLSKWRKL